MIPVIALDGDGATERRKEDPRSGRGELEVDDDGDYPAVGPFAVRGPYTGLWRYSHTHS